MGQRAGQEAGPQVARSTRTRRRRAPRPRRRSRDRRPPVLSTTSPTTRSPSMAISHARVSSSGSIPRDRQASSRAPIRAWPQATRWSATRCCTSAASNRSGEVGRAPLDRCLLQGDGQAQHRRTAEVAGPRSEPPGVEQLRLEHPARMPWPPPSRGGSPARTWGCSRSRGALLEVGHDAGTLVDVALEQFEPGCVRRSAGSCRPGPRPGSRRRRVRPCGGSGASRCRRRTPRWFRRSTTSARPRRPGPRCRGR